MVWCDHEVFAETPDELVENARGHVVEVHEMGDHEAFDLKEYGLLIKSAMRTVEP